jgi:predicted restriction endonuclease
MKLVNFASLDPAQRARGVSGLSKASKADRAIWNSFHADWERAAVESQGLYEQRVAAPTDKRTDRRRRIPTDEELADRKEGPTEATRSVSVRMAQNFFRRAVLASYGARCCVSGIELEELLIASHILPWAKYPELRINPRNGLCLSTLHDAAFDRGLITFDDEHRLVVSARLKEQTTNATLRAAFAKYAGKPIQLPEKFAPDEALLSQHRETVFKH